MGNSQSMVQPLHPKGIKTLPKHPQPCGRNMEKRAWKRDSSKEIPRIARAPWFEQTPEQLLQSRGGLKLLQGGGDKAEMTPQGDPDSRPPYVRRRKLENQQLGDSMGKNSSWE